MPSDAALRLLQSNLPGDARHIGTTFADPRNQLYRWLVNAANLLLTQTGHPPGPVSEVIRIDVTVEVEVSDCALRAAPLAPAPG